jgi:hypothetical protein
MDYNARMYDVGIGRFIQPDNIVQDLVSNQTWNRYTYVLNNPIMWIDPNGHSVYIPPINPLKDVIIDPGPKKPTVISINGPKLKQKNHSKTSICKNGINNCAISFPSIDFPTIELGIIAISIGEEDVLTYKPYGEEQIIISNSSVNLQDYEFSFANLEITNYTTTFIIGNQEVSIITGESLTNGKLGPSVNGIIGQSSKINLGNLSNESTIKIQISGRPLVAALVFVGVLVGGNVPSISNGGLVPGLH